MFKKKECPNCHKKYDEMEQVCPYCETPYDLKESKKVMGNKASFMAYWKEIVLFVLGFLGFQLLGYIISKSVSAIANSVIADPDAYSAFIKSAQMSALVNFSAYLILVVCLIAVLGKDSLKLTKSFKNWAVPIAAVVGMFAIIAFNNIYNIILNICNLSVKDNDNESTLTNIVQLYPLISIIVFVFIGPLCEEITYRVGLYSFLRRINKYLAFALTMIVFTLIHFDFTGANMINELLNIPYYLFAAFVFTFIYEKFGFAASLGAHVSNNFLSIIATIISLAANGKL